MVFTKGKYKTDRNMDRVKYCIKMDLIIEEHGKTIKEMDRA
jgi:hypothetical protein